MRFDQFVSQKLNISRNKALELIENESVLLNDHIYKPAFNVYNLMQDELKLTLLDEVYVSRAALKLKGFLSEFELDLKGKKCLDIGSSTGGFVQVLLENDVARVVALDVGYKQLHTTLKNNPLVQSVEKTDIKDFKSTQRFDLITCDISFISLTKVLFYIDQLAQDLILLLFKPQFEVGIKVKRHKNGVIKDEKAIIKARAEFEKECAKFGWLLQVTTLSKLKGKEGNVEFFYLYSKAKD